MNCVIISIANQDESPEPQGDHVTISERTQSAEPENTKDSDRESASQTTPVVAELADNGVYTVRAEPIVVNSAKVIEDGSEALNSSDSENERKSESGADAKKSSNYLEQP